MAKPVYLTILALFLAACSSRAAPAPLLTDPISTPMPVEAPTATPEPTRAPQATHPTHRTATPTRTPLPDEIRHPIHDYYQLMLMFQAYAMVLDETAREVETGKLSVVGSIDRLGPLAYLAEFMSEMDPALSVYQPPDKFADSWGPAVQVHETTRDVLMRWTDGEMDASAVLEEMAGPLVSIQETLSQVEDILVDQYGFDRDELQAEQDALPAEVAEFLILPTLTPTPWPDSVLQAAVETYYGILAVYGRISLLIALAQKVNSGALPNSYAVETLLSLDTLNGKLDKGLGQIHPPPVLDAYWRQALIDYQAFKDLVTRWVSLGIDSSTVLRDSAGTLTDIQNTLAGAEDIFVDDFGMDRKDVETLRNEYITHIDQLIASVSASESPEGGLYILSYQSYVEGNLYKIIGEVQNTSSFQYVTDVQVIATLYDTNNQVLRLVSTNTIRNTIPPGGGKSPFELVMGDSEAGVAFTLGVQGQAGGMGREDLYVINETASQTGSNLVIAGEVLNTGTSQAEAVMVIATLYDAGGRVVGVGYAVTAPDSIPAGETAAFVLSAGWIGGYDHYELLVQGY